MDDKLHPSETSIKQDGNNNALENNTGIQQDGIGNKLDASRPSHNSGPVLVAKVLR